RIGSRLTLLFVDLDNFKQINDTLGHESGDITLKAAAAVLKDSLRQADILGRLGGDEFAALLAESSNAPDDTSIHDRLRENLTRQNQTLPADFPLELSYGFAHLEPEHPRTLDELLAEADKHMYLAKQKKKAARPPDSD
ncbi:MAG: GGDEF domain-containing protein, partial [Desulfobacterales bacterium]|nr:GGDEF domain-containing protein [Desulfobacterales bacterium]